MSPTCIPSASAALSFATPQAGDGNPWAGYVASSRDCDLTRVTGQWVQPKISCPGSYRGAEPETDFWAGLDGGAVGSDTIEQTGTTGITTCTWR